MVVLRESGREALEVVVFLIKGKSHMERLQGVNLVAVAGAVRRLVKVLNSVLVALATRITVRVVAEIVRGVAFVWRTGPGILVRLHDVKLGAPVAIDLVCVAVAPAISVHPKGAVRVLARHRDEVESGDATALVLTQINVVLD